jgi:hypothetical protein
MLSSNFKPNNTYRRRLVRRWRRGLLHPFRCVRCGNLALDPLGWDGPERPICADCEAVADLLDIRQVKQGGAVEQSY